MMRLFCGLVALPISLAMMGSATAGEPLQADVPVQMPRDPGAANTVSAWVEIEGAATVTVTARNQMGGQVVEIDMVFDYRTPPGVLALDELIDRIEIDTEDLGAGEPYNFGVIDSNLIPLNPNRASLSYRVSLYYPQAPKGYIARVKVFGNYE
jgi:hypothetical protein